MECSITVAGAEKKFKNLEIGQAVHFAGVKNIIASAISHESKNRYTVCMIFETHVLIQSGATLHDAAEYLQHMYDKYGALA